MHNETAPLNEGQNNASNTMIEIETTAERVYSYNSLPNAFTLDSIIFNDSATRYHGKIYFPKSKNDKLLSDLIESRVESEMYAEGPDDRGGDIEFDMWLEEFTVSKTLVTCVFRVQSYLGGAAHFNHWNVILNYDTVKREEVLFKDIFKFSDDKAKRAFCNKFKIYLDGSSDSGDEDTSDVSHLPPEATEGDVCYSVSDGELTIYPNFDCAMEDVTYNIDLKLVQDYIDPARGESYGLFEITVADYEKIANSYLLQLCRIAQTN